MDKKGKRIEKKIRREKKKKKGKGEELIIGLNQIYNL